MKKSLIALAVLAASGAAMAQSSVTLYGVADAYFGSKKVEINGVGQRQTVVDTGGVNSSRWGLKGSEDLGNGMKAIFTLESGFNIDTGAATDATRGLFNRQAFVGVQSEFGAVTLGRQYSAYYGLQSPTNQQGDAPTFNSFNGFNGGVAANGLKDYANRVDNSIAYTSPNFSGFSGAVNYSFGENKNVAVVPATTPATFNNSKATDTASMHLKYANGPVLVGFAYQEEKQPALIGVSQAKLKYALVAGSYDFGVAKLMGAYNEAKLGSTKDKEGQISVVVPFGAAAVSAGYSRSKSSFAGGENTGKGFTILGTYDLSKRTRLYAGAQRTKAFIGNQVTVAGAAIETKSTVYGLGVRHAF
ncbi:MAG: porin [Polaromonas sp.]